MKDQQMALTAAGHSTSESRKLKTADTSSSKKAVLRSTRSVSILPLRPPQPRVHLRKSETQDLAECNKWDIPQEREVCQVMNNVNIPKQPEPYLDPIVTKPVSSRQHAPAQVTEPVTLPARSKPPLIPPPRLIRLAKSQRDLQRCKINEGGESKRERKQDLAYLVVDLKTGKRTHSTSTHKKSFGEFTLSKLVALSDRQGQMVC